MVTLRRGTVIFTRKFDIVSADEDYRTGVCEGGAPSVFANVHSDDQHLLWEMAEALLSEDKVSLCFRMNNNKGEYCWVSASCTKMGQDCICMEIQDLTSAIENGAKISELDYLTGLYNKKAITDYVRKECAEHKANIINLCILDIDNFKYINDTYGHSYGDKIIKEVSSIILDVLGNDGRAGRIGGDEIMLIIENVEEKTDLRVYLKGIRERVEATHLDQNGIPQVTVSIGVGTFPLYVDNYDDLFDLADRMLYRAKSRGKNRYVIYNPDIHGKIVNGELDETSVSITKTTAIEKTRLIMESLDGLFLTDNEAIPSLLMKIVATYNLDQGYVFYKDLSKSYYGFKKVADSGNATDIKVLKIIEAVSEIVYAKEPGFDAKFNSNGVCVIDTPNSQLSKTVEPLKFFNINEIKHAFFYKMQGCEGYVAFYNTRDLSRKFPQPDITDLTYLSKMIEIAMKTR